MFDIKDPSTVQGPWVLSRGIHQIISIPEEITKHLKNHDILAIDFLYQNCRKQFRGAVLNEESGMNVQLQVSAFLCAMYKAAKQKFLVLILAPSESILKWHYHLSIHGGLQVREITPETCPEEFDQEHGLALLLSFSNLKLAEYLIGYDYFSVVIDNMDLIATKLIVKKLYGDFNIGISQRNFYVDPSQKLQWTMLNWSNPGCVGKLADFYEVDNDNFANFRDNYKYWWCRITWNFCDTFKKPSDEEQQRYRDSLSEWAKKSCIPIVLTENKKKRKKVQTNRKLNTKKTLKEESSDVKLETMYKAQTSEEQTPDIKCCSNTDSSNDTIIYELDESIPSINKIDPQYVKLPSMDENPIVTSIKRNLEKSPEPSLSNQPHINHIFNLDDTNCHEPSDEDDIILAIANNETIPKLEDENIAESIIFDIDETKPGTSKGLFSMEPDDFVKSLMCKSEDRSSDENDESGNFLKSLVKSENHEFQKCDEERILMSDDSDIESDHFLKGLASSNSRISERSINKCSETESVVHDIERVLREADDLLNS